MTTINMIGKPCPIPVVEAKKALSQPGVQGLTVLVDNIIAVQNLEKMATGLGYTFSHEQKSETEFAVIFLAENVNNGNNAAANTSTPVSQPTCAPMENSGGITCFITYDQLGISEAEPAQKLLRSFLLSLAQMPVPPRAILLLNTGVKLAAEGSHALDELKALAELGVDIRACGQCLTYYGLIDKLLVGKVSNMLEIVEIVSSSARVVTV